jgi:hypothetical protein
VDVSVEHDKVSELLQWADKQPKLQRLALLAHHMYTPPGHGDAWSKRLAHLDRLHIALFLQDLFWDRKKSTLTYKEDKSEDEQNASAELGCQTSLLCLAAAGGFERVELDYHEHDEWPAFDTATWTAGATSSCKHLTLWCVYDYAPLRICWTHVKTLVWHTSEVTCEEPLDMWWKCLSRIAKDAPSMEDIDIVHHLDTLEPDSTGKIPIYIEAPDMIRAFPALRRIQFWDDKRDAEHWLVVERQGPGGLRAPSTPLLFR